MRKYLQALLTICLLRSSAHSQSKHLYFPQVGWHLRIPKHSDLLSSSQVDSLQESTANRIHSQAFKLDSQEVLFVFKSGEGNMFAANVSQFDSTKSKDWQEAYRSNKDLLIAALLLHKAAETTVDTASATEEIDGRLFQRFIIRTNYQGIVRETYWYYRWENGLDFSINISCVDMEKKRKFLRLFRSTRFDR